MPENSPIASQQGQTSAFEFDYVNERNAITPQKIKNLVADWIQAGTIAVQVNIGGANVYIDGANNRIVINDGTVDRVLIGYLSGGF